MVLLNEVIWQNVISYFMLFQNCQNFACFHSHDSWEWWFWWHHWTFHCKYYTQRCLCWPTSSKFQWLFQELKNITRLIIFSKIQIIIKESKISYLEQRAKWLTTNNFQAASIQPSNQWIYFFEIFLHFLLHVGKWFGLGL